MENRFGFKDMVVIILLLVLILSVWLAMKQLSRQWERIAVINTKLEQQSGAQGTMQSQLSKIQLMLESGVQVSGQVSNNTKLTTDNPNEDSFDPFARVKEAKAKPDYAQGDQVVDVFATKVAKLTAYLSTDVYADVIERKVLESLLAQDPITLEDTPFLAKSWQVTDNTETYKKFAEPLIAKLRQGIDDNPKFKQFLAEQWATFKSDKKEIPEQGTSDYTDLIEVMRQKWIAQVIKKHPDRPTAVIITFQLRRGLTFSDGQPLTAKDVVFTYQFINNPKLDCARTRGFYDKIESVEANGDYEVVFKFREPYFAALGMAGGMRILPKHFYGKLPSKEINENPGLLMGSGPYRLETPDLWKPGQLIILYRNERYWGEKPSIKRLIYKEISNPTSRLTAFRNGDIDLFAALPEQYVKMIKEKELVNKTKQLVYYRADRGYLYIAWNQRKRDRSGPSFFADKRVRQAMTMLIDRERLLNTVYRGYGYILTGPFNYQAKQYDHSIQPWPYDVERAKKLLKECGFIDRNNDGILEDKKGNPFRFKLTFPTSATTAKTMSLMMKDSFAKAGIIVEPDSLEWSVYSDRLKSRDFDAVTLGWGSNTESDIRQMFHSSQIAGSADNFMGYKSPLLDKMIDKARSTVDEQVRIPLWHQCHKIIHDEQPYTFLFSLKSLVFIDKRFSNIQRVPLGLNSSTEWYVPLELQKYKN